MVNAPSAATTNSPVPATLPTSKVPASTAAPVTVPVVSIAPAPASTLAATVAPTLDTLNSPVPATVARPTSRDVKSARPPFVILATTSPAPAVVPIVKSTLAPIMVKPTPAPVMVNAPLALTANSAAPPTRPTSKVAASIAPATDTVIVELVVPTALTDMLLPVSKTLPFEWPPVDVVSE